MVYDVCSVPIVRHNNAFVARLCVSKSVIRVFFSNREQLEGDDGRERRTIHSLAADGG